MTEQIIIKEHKLFLTGSRASQTVLICPMMSEQLHKAEEQWQRIKALSTAGGAVTEDFLLAAFEVKDWNGELSPWETHIEGIGEFAGKADKTLDLILKGGIPVIREVLDGKDAFEKYGAGMGQGISDSNVDSDREQSYDGQRKLRWMIGGYSLAGLFALWSMYQTDVFCGAAGCSASLWYPGFMEYVKSHTLPKESRIYLSLGTKEEKARQPVLSGVGDAARELYEHYQQSGAVKTAALEWNPGNHFKDADERMDKGFSWLLKM